MLGKRVCPLKRKFMEGCPMSSVTLNKPIADFERIDQFEKQIRLKDLKQHRYTVIYFYPKDNTSG
jgi:peroxiredoxin